MGAVTQTTPADPAPAKVAGGGQRQHILAVALSLMSQQGVDGTSMRELASAAGLNVASLYHYFPSKRDLLVAVLREHGVVDAAASSSAPSIAGDLAVDLGDLLADVLDSMLEVEDFVRLMLGEVLRGDETAHAVGLDLFAATKDLLERWLDENRPDLCPPENRPALARVLRALLVGLYFEHVAGVLEEHGTPTAEVLRDRALESASFFDK
jgi:AcrR family transcriptional regulator